MKINTWSKLFLLGILGISPSLAEDHSFFPWMKRKTEEAPSVFVRPSQPQAEEKEEKEESKPTPSRSPEVGVREVKTSGSVEPQPSEGLLKRKVPEDAILTREINMKRDNAIPEVPLKSTSLPPSLSREESHAGHHVENLREEFSKRLKRVNDPELSNSYTTDLEAVPSDFESAWSESIRSNLLPGTDISRDIASLYESALRHSYQVCALTYSPLIEETNIGVAEAQFDTETFTNASGEHVDEPTGTILATGTTGRLTENDVNLDFGLRKRLRSGTEMEITNELQTIDNNSTYLDPNPQSQSRVTFSIIQPLMRGRGVNYNTISVKIAQLDSRIAAREMIQALEAHLLEINRNYWAVYLARANYVQRQELVKTTEKIVKLLEDRAEIDPEATASEILRANAALIERRADLIRSRTSIRTAEERLRFLLNDPEIPMGDQREMIPATRPILSPPPESFCEVAECAIDNSPLVERSFDAIKTAALRKESSRNDLKPQLNFLGEVAYAGLGENHHLGNAYGDMFQHGTNWRFGLNYSQTLERRFAKSFNQRRSLEYLEAITQAKLAGDSVILTVLVSYRELATAYRDMQAKYQAVKASREEVRKLEELVELDAGEDIGRTVGYRLQLLLDAIERNQSAEEAFLVSLVAYNFSLTAIERAKGTFLQINDVRIGRKCSGTWECPDGLDVTQGGPGK